MGGGIQQAVWAWGAVGWLGGSSRRLGAWCLPGWGGVWLGLGKFCSKALPSSVQVDRYVFRPGLPHPSPQKQGPAGAASLGWGALGPKRTATILKRPRFAATREPVLYLVHVRVVCVCARCAVTRDCVAQKNRLGLSRSRTAAKNKPQPKTRNPAAGRVPRVCRVCAAAHAAGGDGDGRAGSARYAPSPPRRVPPGC